MKILIVCQFYYPENFVITKIAEKLVEFKHDVTVLTGKPNYGYGYILEGYENIKEEVINGVKVNRVDLIPRSKTRLSIIKNYLSFWKNSKKWIKNCKEKFDIVYSMSLSPVTILSAGNLYKKKHHVPHVMHCVDLWPESVLVTKAVRKKSLLYRFLYRLSKNLYSKADEILIGSPSFKEYFTDVLKIKDIELKFVPQPSLLEKCELEPYQYDNQYFNILYCGNLGLIQQIPYIVDAAERLKDTNIRFHVIGMGPMREYLEEEINKRDLSSVLIYHGPIPAKIASSYFLSADALYVSLKDEGYVGKTIPNKLVMSMAYGKPVIAMLEGDGKDILMSSHGGLYSPQDVTSLVETIKKMSNMSKHELLEMGNNNLNFYKNNLNIEHVSRLVEQELLNKI